MLVFDPESVRSDYFVGPDLQYIDYFTSYN